MGRPKVTSFVDAALRDRAIEDRYGLQGGVLATRLTAIIALSKNLPLETICQVFDITRKTLFRWVRDYKAFGLDGLWDRARGHRQRNLTPQQEEEIKGWVRNQVDPDGQPVHWTLEQLSLTILERMGVSLSIPRVGYWLRTWGFSPKVPRPRHKKADPKAQEEFKKKSGGSSRKTTGGRSRAD